MSEPEKDKEAQPKKVKRISRKDAKILKAFARRTTKLQRTYDRWKEARCDELGIYPEWCRRWTTGHVIDADDPKAPVTLKPLPDAMRVRARKFEDELVAHSWRMDDFMDRLADEHDCASTDIVMQQIDRTGKPTNKRFGVIETHYDEVKTADGSVLEEKEADALLADLEKAEPEAKE